MQYVVGISEIVLWTAADRRALQFYQDLLGLAVISPPTLPNVFLKAGEGNTGIPLLDGETWYLIKVGVACGKRQTVGDGGSRGT